MVTQHIKKLCEDEDIVKSGQDKRCYRGLELTNGMKILLVSDPEADKSAASLDVHIGHMSDPKELPGLAHFCEHMLFLGTEKYPEENEYTKYLNEHGGCSNAFTSAEHTNFYFDVSPEHIGGALDRFSQFFLYPLFTPSATEREVNAVHLENEKNLPNDAWRLQQLNKSTSNPQHDFNKFGTGNKYTLETRPKEQGIDVRKELLHFHFKYYSSNIMTLAVVAKESVEELMEMIVPLFSCVENKNLTLPEWPIHPFGPEQLKVKVCAVPVKDIRNLAITWPIPDLQYYYKSQPGRYLSHLIGHEGPGSLLSELKARGWVNTLLGGQQTGAKGFMFFIVNVDLTEEGLEHVDSIVLLTFQYLNMLKKEGPKEWIFKECQNLNAMTFRFKDKEVSRSYVTSLSDHLSEYPMEDVLCGPYLLRDFRSDLIEMVLSKLLPETVRVAVIAKKFEGETNLKEEWYGTDYKIEKIPEETLESWRECGYLDNLKLPERNEFIPTNFDLYCKDEGVAQLPELIKDTTTSRLWYKQDTKFLLPKACLSFELRSPQAYMDPTQTDMTCLFVLLFKDALTEYAYAADIAGLHYNLENTIYGINLAIRGYNDKQHILLRKIMGKLTSFEVDPKRFEIMKEMYARGLRNFNAEQPHHHAVYYTSVLMSELLWTKEELLDALEDVTLDKLQAFIPLLLSKVFIEGLVYGNTTKQRALEMLAMMEQVLQEKVHTKPLLPSQHKFFRELQLPDGCHFIYKKVNEVFPSSCIEIYYQCDMQNTHSNMVLELFNQIFGEPFFNVLRTQEQLGYVIYSGVRRVSGVQGFRVIIQSDRSSDYVESRVEAFLFTIDEYLQNMTEEEFQRHIAALAAKMLEQPKKLSSQNMKYWSEITAQQYHFDRSNIEAAYLRTLTKDDLLGFYREKIAHNAPKRHKLSVHVVPAQSSVSDKIQDGLSTTDRPQPVEVTDLAAFKRHLALFPLPKPFIDIQKAKSKL